MRKESTFCIKFSIGTRIDIKLLGQFSVSFLMKNTVQSTPSLLRHDPDVLLNVMTMYCPLPVVLKLSTDAKLKKIHHSFHKQLIVSHTSICKDAKRGYKSFVFTAEGYD
jgi:hypothetical protein